MSVLTEHQKAALDYSRHLSLTANAGSGKTFVLSRRYVEIALNEKIPLRRIAAITFTDKAAGELYKKIASEIDNRINSSSIPDERVMLENIRRQLVSANISTIHSFCIDILREHPVEAKLDANFTPVDETTASELIEISVEETVKNLLDDKIYSEAIKTLIRISGSRNLLTKELKNLLSKRKNVLHLQENVYNLEESSIADFLRQKCITTVETIFNIHLEELLRSLIVVNDLVLQNDADNSIALSAATILNRFPCKDSAEVSRNLTELKSIVLTTTNTLREKGYLRKNLKEDVEYHIAVIEELLPDLSSLTLPAEGSFAESALASYGKTVINVFLLVLEAYEARKKENGYIDFEDILLLVRKILAEQSVRETLSEKYDYIMVDEYQDTNEIQYDIFLPLLDDLKRGNLFVVGDEKQSIYMFRDAELEVFNKTRQDITRSSGNESMLILPDTFRMAPALCLFTNFVFEKLFHNPVSLYNEVGYQEIVCAREKDKTGSVEILIASEKKRGEDTTPSGMSQVEMVAGKIIALADPDSATKESEWREIAILVRKRKFFDEIENTFIKYNIPFTIVGGKGFYQRQAIYDIYNYFSFLLDSDNDRALAGILRSPFFTLSDSALFEISMKPGKSLFAKLTNYASENKAVQLITDKLMENLSLSRSTDPSSMLRKILEESNLLVVLASRAGGKQELANIDKLISKTIAFSSDDFNTLYDYVNFLGTAIETVHDEAQAPVSDEANSVKVMTLHQAKGLEFPVVFLYGCEDDAGSEIVRQRSITLSKDFGILAKLPDEENYLGEFSSAPIIDSFHYVNRRKNIAEMKRLFYVGVTRAMDKLILSSEAPGKSGFKSASFMGQLIKVFPQLYHSDELIINDNLDFLEKSEEMFVTHRNKLKLVIPIVKDSIPEFESSRAEDILLTGSVRTEKIYDTSEGEFISATKLTVFNQCPVKYRLIYDYGFREMADRVGVLSATESKPFDFKSTEDLIDAGEDQERIINAGLKGTVIHKLLQIDITPKSVKDRALKEIRQELDVPDPDESVINRLAGEIDADLQLFLNSAMYDQIKSFSNYINEYEVYLSENDYYLYGIIDKMILEQDRIIIIDYKTDDIETDEITDRALSYSTQTKFYLYILSKLYENIDKFESRVLFIKHPETPVVNYYSAKELRAVSDQVREMVYKIRNSAYNKNKDHCPRCIFSPDRKKCVIT